jgi:glycosyltransferase involved in cell wall biosynthesis
MSGPIRVALFSDSHYETNGVARTAGALEAYASRRRMPLLSIHAGPVTRLVQEDGITRLELERCRATSFGLEHDLHFDLAMWRHLRRVAHALRSFHPDVLHFTGPSDIGQIGAYLGHRLSIPMVGSWHTNLHEYASRRLRLTWMREATRTRVRAWAERESLKWCLRFYHLPRVVLAPNRDLLKLLEIGTGKPAFLMSRGVDVEMFSPTKRSRTDAVVNIGYVGRLSPEKSVRLLAQIEQALVADGCTSIRFTIVGEGKEREWLRRHLDRATFAGVLRGETLAAAYANMDLFAFPSETETFGNVVLEAMASGVPVVAMARGGPKFLAGPGPSLALAHSHVEFVDTVRRLARDAAQRKVMGAAARARALQMSWDRIFDAVYRAYAEAVLIAHRPTTIPAGSPVVRSADA